MAAKRVGQAFISVSPSFRGFKTQTVAFAKTIQPIKVPVEVDASKVVVKPPKKPVKVPTEVDTKRFDRALSYIERRLDRLAKGRFIINVGVAMSPLAAPAGAVGAGGGAGLLGIGTGVLGGAGAFAAVAAQQQKAIEEVLKEADKLNAAGKTAEAQAMMESLSAGQNKVADSTARLKSNWFDFLATGDGAAVLKPMNMFINGLNRSLPFLGAFLKPVALGFEQIFRETGKEADKGSLLKVASQFGEFSRGVLVDAGRGTRNLARAFWNLLDAFMPLSNDMSGGLVTLTKRFENWTAGLERSKGFQSFVSYVKTNGPVLLSTFGALGLALIEVGIAIAPLAEQMLGFIARFSSWLANFAQAHPQIVQFAVGILVASRALAAIAQVIGPVVTMFRTLRDVGFFLYGVVGKLIGVLGFVWRLFLNLTPWGRVISIAILLGGALVTAYKKSDTFRAVVNRAFDVVRKGAGKLKDAFVAVKKGIGEAWGGLKGVIERPLKSAIGVVNMFIRALNKLPFVNLKEISFGEGSGSSKKGVVRAKGRHATGGRGRVLMGDGGRRSSLLPKNSGGRGGKGGSGGRAWPANTKALSGNYPGHSGVDIAAGMGSPIKAAASGTVQYVGWGRGYGQAIFQSVPGGMSAVYGHTSKTNVKAGQKVRPGQVIGRVGSTGRSTGPHLHFELNAAGPFGSVGNRAATLSWLGGARMTKGGSTGPFDSIGDLNAWVDRNAKGSGSNGIINVGGLMGYLGDESRGWLKKKFFDRGGLATTVGYLQKNVQAPERMLSPRQTQAFEGWMGRGAPGGETQRLHREDLDYLADRIGSRVLAGADRVAKNHVSEHNRRNVLEVLS